MGGTAFTVRGEGFPNGSVTLSMDGAVGGGAQSSDDVFTATLIAPGSQYSYGNVTVTATAADGSGVTASVVITEIGAPK